MVIDKRFWNSKVELSPLSFSTWRSKTSRSRFSGLYREFWTLKMSDHESKSKKNYRVPDVGQQERCFDVYIV